LKKKSARAKSKKCGKIFQFWSPAKRDGGSGYFVSLSVFLAVLAPKSRPCADGKMELPFVEISICKNLLELVYLSWLAI
jgi:hypothetical protein